MRRWRPLGSVWCWLGWLGLLAGCTPTKSLEPVAGNPFAAGRVGTDSTLEVMTWNLEHFPKRGPTTVQQVQDVVTGLQVDIVALQEIEDLSAFSQVVAGLEGWSGQRASSASFQVNLAFLYRTGGALQVSAIYEILSGYRREFPRRPYVLEGTFNGAEIVVINNHYKAMGDNRLEPGNPWDQETRRRDASLLLADFIASHFAGRAVFVVGDFNDELTDPAPANVFANFLAVPDSFAFVDMAIATGPSTGWSYPAWPSHLDHILINQPLFAAANAVGAAVQVVPLADLLGQGWGYYDTNISDHLPVVVRLRP